MVYDAPTGFLISLLFFILGAILATLGKIGITLTEIRDRMPPR